MIFLSRYIREQFRPAEQYQLSGQVFLKLLALIYFAAFYSLSTQIVGLVGSEGILPFHERLGEIHANFGNQSFWRLPTLFWINSSDFSLQIATYAGCFFALALLTGWKPELSLILLFVLYLSLFHAGQTFLTFQWDTLLLECGFLAIFLQRYPVKMVFLLYYLLLFRLRFLSGISKLLSGDPTWADLSALQFYFETQPLPHIGAWYAHHLPAWALQSGVILVYIIEILVPLFIFLPRRFRIFAAVSTIILQLFIIATSNHNFVNLLTIVLCLLLLDDQIIGRFLPARLKLRMSQEKIPAGLSYKLLLPAFAVIIITISFSTAYRMISKQPLPPLLAEASHVVRYYGLGHTYHIFPTMQTERHELQVEGSYNGRQWLAYDFKYKPGPLGRTPAFIVPHQPRLDWMIWFAPAKHDENMFWMDNFMHRLAEESAPVLDLLRHNPFPEQPPTRLRVMSYRYHFTTPEEHKNSGNWWKRELLGEFPYLPPRIP